MSYHELLHLVTGTTFTSHRRSVNALGQVRWDAVLIGWGAHWATPQPDPTLYATALDTFARNVSVRWVWIRDGRCGK